MGFGGSRYRSRPPRSGSCGRLALGSSARSHPAVQSTTLISAACCDAESDAYCVCEAAGMASGWCGGVEEVVVLVEVMEVCVNLCVWFCDAVSTDHLPYISAT